MGLTFKGGVTLQQNSKFGAVRGSTPSWITPSGSLGSTHELSAVSYTIAADDLGSGKVLNYELISGSLPTGSTLDANTGAITGPAVSVASTTTYDFVIRTTMGGGSATTRDFAITINNNLYPLWLTNAGLLGTFNVGTVFNYQISAIDLDAPGVVTFSIVSGSLPPGLSISSSGKITGTTSALNGDYTFVFTVRASDGYDFSDRQFWFVINAIRETHNITISSHIVDYKLGNHLLTLGWNGINPVDVNFTLNTNIFIGSTSSASPAFDTQAIPTSSTIAITNNGVIEGKGGNGGQGGDPSAIVPGGNILQNREAKYGLPGDNGGNAIKTSIAMTIDNTTGFIVAGGGGGGGGAPQILDPVNDSWVTGGGGGAGAGYAIGSGGLAGVVSVPASHPIVSGAAGSDSTFNTSGAGGAGGVGPSKTAGIGGQGGEEASTGQPGQNVLYTSWTSTKTIYGGTGGAPGNSIDGVSKVTITAGDAPTKILGARIN